MLLEIVSLTISSTGLIFATRWRCHQEWSNYLIAALWFVVFILRILPRTETTLLALALSFATITMPFLVSLLYAINGAYVGNLSYRKT